MRTYSQLFALCALCIAVVLSACSDSLIAPPDHGQLAEDCAAPGDEDGNGLADCSDPACGAVSACLAACGNARLDPGEQCDDGNNLNADGCENDCTRARCGNGIMDIGEKCDDGNRLPSDGCSNMCTIDVPGTPPAWILTILLVTGLTVGTTLLLHRRMGT